MGITTERRRAVDAVMLEEEEGSYISELLHGKRKRKREIREGWIEFDVDMPSITDEDGVEGKET